jgi:hypothetical protein
MIPKLVLRLVAVAGVLLTLAACADSPTQSDPQRAPDLAPGGPVQDQQAQGCVIDGVCILDPVIVDPGACDPWESLDWCSGSCITSVFQPLDPTVQSCPGDGGGGAPAGGGTLPLPSDPGTICPAAETSTCPTEPEPVCEVDCPADGEEEENSDICPQPVRGKTATALVNVAGRNHEFKFSGRMDRVNPLVGRSPAWYKISAPQTSTDNWWIAERGNIQLVCWGRWTWGNRLWVGSIYVQDTELHLVMSAGHPDF